MPLDRTRILLAPMLILALAAAPGPGALAEESDTALADTAFLSITVLEHQMLDDVNQRVPPELRLQARCIAVFPSVVKAGFIVAAKHGNGLVTCREREGGEWGAPAAFNITAASIGIQAGIQSASYILLLLEERAVERLMEETLSFGNDVSLAAGPVGAAARLGHHADVVSYVRTAGLFAGVDLEGAAITFAEQANEQLYGAQRRARQILFEGTDVPLALKPFHETLRRFAPSL